MKPKHIKILINLSISIVLLTTIILGTKAWLKNQRETIRREQIAKIVKASKEFKEKYNDIPMAYARINDSCFQTLRESSKLCIGALGSEEPNIETTIVEATDGYTFRYILGEEVCKSEYNRIDFYIDSSSSKVIYCNESGKEEGFDF